MVALIPLFPLLGFLINGLGFKKIPKSLVGIIGTGASLLAFLIVLVTFVSFTENLNNPIVYQFFKWFSVGGFSVNFAFQVDQLSLIMLLIITGIGTLIHLYSMGYMKEDEGYGKFFAYLNLFLFNMILLVLGANYLITFIGWEGVGLCSYLLIGFWNKRKDFGDAARKAFIMNRIGDLGFLVALFLILQKFGTLEYLEVFSKATSLSIQDPQVQYICLALFVGAMGKSAQIPLFTWLPDAMAGPTPVSALIHAATMVTAGIFLIVRSNVLYTLSPDVLNFIAWIGTATALLGAIIGVFQNDIKKVLAYSTVSQLGYMFIGLGVMAYSSGLFHVITHAFFKALLFLGAGSVIHALHHEQDLRKMGGLWSKTKGTAITFLLGTIAISGIPPFAGFFSKDEILAHVFAHNKLMWVLALIGSLLTAFYMFRLFFLTFTGKYRGENESQIHESPKSMLIPLYVLAGLSVIGGFIGMPEVFHMPHALNNFLDPIFSGSRKVNGEFGHLAVSHSTELMLMLGSVIVALVGLGLAYFMFYKGKNVPGADSTYAGLKKLAYNKFYIDETYQKVFVAPTVILGSFFSSFLEQKVFSGFLNKLGDWTDNSAVFFKKTQSGSTPLYIFIMCLFIALALGVTLIPNFLESIKSLKLK